MQNTSAVKWVIPFFVHKHNVDIASAKGIKHRQTEMEKPIFLSKDHDMLQNT